MNRIHMLIQNLIQAARADTPITLVEGRLTRVIDRSATEETRRVLDTAHANLVAAIRQDQSEGAALAVTTPKDIQEAISTLRVTAYSYGRGVFRTTEEQVDVAQKNLEYLLSVPDLKVWVQGREIPPVPGFDALLEQMLSAAVDVTGETLRPSKDPDAVKHAQKRFQAARDAVRCRYLGLDNHPEDQSRLGLTKAQRNDLETAIARLIDATREVAVAIHDYETKGSSPDKAEKAHQAGKSQDEARRQLLALFTVMPRVPRQPEGLTTAQQTELENLRAHMQRVAASLVK